MGLLASRGWRKAFRSSPEAQEGWNECFPPSIAVPEGVPLAERKRGLSVDNDGSAQC